MDITSTNQEFIKKHQQSFDKLNEKVNLSDDELNTWFKQIQDIIIQTETCEKLKEDECFSPNYLHLALKRNLQGQIEVVVVPCPKKVKKDLTIVNDYKINKSGKDVLEWFNFQIDLYLKNKRNFLNYKLKANAQYKNNLEKQAENSTWKINNVDLLFCKLYEFINDSYKKRKLAFKKTFYLFGKYGTGKSLYMYYLCNKIRDLGFSIALVSTNKLMLQAKKSIDDEENKKYFNTFKQSIKKADLVIFDDIGAEKGNEWFYTEILLDIFDYRMLNNKATFFTSNFSIDQLQDKMVKKYNFTEIDAGRIIERIKALTNDDSFELLSINHRY